MNITVQPDLPMLPVIFLRAWLIKRAWRPTWASPYRLQSQHGVPVPLPSQLPRQRQQSERVDQQFPERIHQYRVGKSADLISTPSAAVVGVNEHDKGGNASSFCTSATACNRVAGTDRFQSWVKAATRARSVEFEDVSHLHAGGIIGA